MAIRRKSALTVLANPLSEHAASSSSQNADAPPPPPPPPTIPSSPTKAPFTNLKNTTPITIPELNTWVIALSTAKTNEDIIEFVSEKKAAFTLTISQILLLITMTESIKTKLALLKNHLSQRCTDPANYKILLTEFTYNDDISMVEKVFKQRELDFRRENDDTRPLSGKFNVREIGGAGAGAGAGRGRGGGRGGRGERSSLSAFSTSSTPKVLSTTILKSSSERNVTTPRTSSVDNSTLSAAETARSTSPIRPRSIDENKTRSGRTMSLIEDNDLEDAEDSGDIIKREYNDAVLRVMKRRSDDMGQVVGEVVEVAAQQIEGLTIAERIENKSKLKAASDCLFVDDHDDNELDNTIKSQDEDKDKDKDKEEGGRESEAEMSITLSVGGEDDNTIASATTPTTMLANFAVTSVTTALAPATKLADFFSSTTFDSAPPEEEAKVEVVDVVDVSLQNFFLAGLPPPPPLRKMLTRSNNEWQSKRDLSPIANHLSREALIKMITERGNTIVYSAENPQPVVSYESLVAQNSEKEYDINLDPRCLEIYLNDAEFEKVFEVDRSTFEGWREWKKKEIKRKVGLF